MKEKKIYLEVMRIIACFFVIVNHTNSKVFLKTEVGTSLWYISIVYFFTCKIAVPIFIMISGTLLLAKVDDYKKSFNRIIRAIIVIILFSLIYYIKDCCLLSEKFSIGKFFAVIFSSNITNAYWYLYLYLGLLIFLPLLQRMIKEWSKREYMYCICITIVFTGLTPLLSHYNQNLVFNPYFTSVTISSYIGMLLLGYYLDRYIILNKKVAIILAVLFISSIFFQVIMTVYESHINPDFYLFYDNCSYLPNIISSMSAFCIIKYFSKKINNKMIEKILMKIGGATFGIYLISDLIISQCGSIYSKLLAFLYPMIAVLVYEVIIFVLGFLVTVILKKVPYIKKIL